MPKRTTVGALVVTYNSGSKSTYRWIDKWTYDQIVVKGLARAKEQTAKAKMLLPVAEHDARTLSEAEFRKKHKVSPAEILLALKNPVCTSVMPLRTIECEPVFKNEYLGYGGSLEINFADVKSVAFKETRAVDDFGP